MATAAVFAGALWSQAAPTDAASAAQPTTCSPGWVAAWHASPSRYTARLDGPMPMTPRPDDAFLRPLTGRTIRMMLRPEANGTAVRLHLTNRYGSRPLRVGRVTVANQDAGPAIVRESAQPVTFGGRSGATIPAGASLISDSAAIQTVADSPLAVSIYLVDAADPVTRHVDTRTTSYVSGIGDYADASPAWPFTQPTTSAFYMDGIDVMAPVRMNAVIAVGDSITDGTGTTEDGRNRWTDALQRRLNAAEPGRLMVVLNAAIGANRLLVDAPFHHGESAISRLRWDLASNAGVTDVILHEGTNDIGLRSARNAKPIIAGMKRFASDAHSLGLRAFATTITPANIGPYGDRRANRTRDTVNQWIRKSGASVFDGVFDFAASVANPSRRSTLATPYDAGDTLHLSDLGQDRLAGAVDLTQLTGSPCLAPQ